MNPFAGPIAGLHGAAHVSTVFDRGTARTRAVVFPPILVPPPRPRAVVTNFGLPAAFLNPVGNAAVRVAPRSKVYHRHTGCRRLKGESKVCRLVEVKGTHRACKVCRPVE